MIAGEKGCSQHLLFIRPSQVLVKQIELDLCRRHRVKGSRIRALGVSANRRL